MIKYAKIKALIIEDFAEFASAVSIMLRDMGVVDFQVVTSGEAGIQACREKKFDVILSDYNLGEKKDGQQVLEELISLKLISPTCSFIMITAEKTASMVMAALEFQPDSYLTKPFNAGLLKSRVDKSLRKKRCLASIEKLIRQKKWAEAFKQSEITAVEHPKYQFDCGKLQFECLKRAKKYEKALELVERISKGRSTPWSLNSVGTIYYRQQNLEYAEKIFSQMITEYPMALEGYDWLAKIQHQLDRPVDAQTTLEQAVIKSPKLLKRQRYLGQLAEQNNDIEAMTQAYRQAVKYGKHSMFSSADEYVKLTKSIGHQLNSNSNEDRSRLISEAKNLFKQLEERFKTDVNVQFRGAVAHAGFSAIIQDAKSLDKQLDNANQYFDRIDEHISADDSLEIAESLKALGLSQLAECVLEEAVEQYFDNPIFMKRVAKITTNKFLIKNAQEANKINNQAVKSFKQNHFPQAISLFEQAGEIAPNNVNICLNHAQALLKQYQMGAKQEQDLYSAEKVLTSITRLSIKDPRYSRFSELTRLNQLMLQKL